MTFYQYSENRFDLSENMSIRGRGQFDLWTYLMWVIKGHHGPLVVYLTVLNSIYMHFQVCICYLF